MNAPDSGGRRNSSAARQGWRADRNLVFVTALLGGVCVGPRLAFPGNPAASVAVIVADDPLACWPLADSLEPVRAARDFTATLEHGGGAARFRPGPVAGGRSIDLGRGGWLRLPSHAALEAAELTVEMVFQPKYPNSGGLFGMRDGNATRFSLHATVDSPRLKLWNGSRVVDFEAVRPVSMNSWHHVALAISSDEATVWLDGVRCSPSSRAGLDPAVTGLPLLVGCTSADGTTERSEILVAQFAVHRRRLPDDRIRARIEALGWGDRLRPGASADPAAAVASIGQRVAAIERDHGVVVKYRYSAEEFLPAAWRSDAEAVGVPLERVPGVLDEIEAFLAVVPAAVTRRDLETIYVVDRLSLNGGPVGALASGKSIYLCCGRPAFDIRCSLYHELSHILQVAHPIDDDAWRRLLPEGFDYLGADAGVDAFGFDDRLRKDGFILRYSLTNRHEDIAVLSDWLFVRKQQAFDLCDAYPAIRRKAAAVIAWYEAIDPGYELDEFGPVIQGADPTTISQPRP